MGRPRNTVDRMLVHNVNQTEGCWIWKGPKCTNGYGKTAVMKRTLLAHRVFYEHFNGHIPDGRQIDHVCRNRLCVNPDHLEAVTHRENILRGDSLSADNARKTECHQGHPLAGRNLYVTPDGRRQCRTCQNARGR